MKDICHAHGSERGGCGCESGHVGGVKGDVKYGEDRLEGGYLRNIGDDEGKRIRSGKATCRAGAGLNPMPVMLFFGMQLMVEKTGLRIPCQD